MEGIMSNCDSCSAEIKALKAELTAQIDELKTIIKFAMSDTQATPSQQVASLTDGSALRLMTSKQHAAMQMWLFGGMRIADIARRMGCSRNTARLHLKAVWVKMGTDDKAEISARLLPILDEVTDAEYSEWSGGLPKNWAATYVEGGTDPYLNLYVKSKEDSYVGGNTKS